MIRVLGICLLLAASLSSKEMTLEQKRVENAIYAIVGEKPPHDVPLNHKEQTLHDMLVTSVKAVRESHVGHDPKELMNTTTPSPVEKTDPEIPTATNAMAQFQNQETESHKVVMSIWFHFGHSEVILFDFWRINNKLELAISCGIIFVMGTMYEGLKWFRVYLTLHRILKRKESFHLPVVVTVTDGRALKDASVPLFSQSKKSTPEIKNPGPFSLIRIVQSVLYIVQLVVAYCLMLIVMTYNVWLTVAVVLGAGFGHWMFASLRSANPSGETTENIATDACH